MTPINARSRALRDGAIMDQCALVAEKICSAEHGCATLADHRRDQQLCAALETLADGLPDLPPSDTLSDLFRELIEARLRWDQCQPISAQDPSHRYLDALQAEDVREALFDYWAAPDPHKVGQLSYMLRALFDGRRRAIQIEILSLGCAACTYSDAH